MPNDEDHSVTDKLLGSGNTLLRTTEIIGNNELHRLAERAVAALMSATANSAPRSIWSPSQASRPVIEPAAPIKMSAWAG
jgi:hypothetical protein